MSKQYDNNMRGRIYKNDYKKAPNQPDYRGECEIDGVVYEQALWIKFNPQNKPYFSVQYKIKEDRPKFASAKSAPSMEEVKEEMDDFVPF